MLPKQWKSDVNPSILLLSKQVTRKRSLTLGLFFFCVIMSPVFTHIFFIRVTFFGWESDAYFSEPKIESMILNPLKSRKSLQTNQISWFFTLFSMDKKRTVKKYFPLFEYFISAHYHFFAQCSSAKALVIKEESKTMLLPIHEEN